MTAAVKVFFSRIWNEKENIVQEAKKFSALNLLALKNSTWLMRDEIPETKQGFMERMQLSGISISKEKFQLEFEDGELFCGHAIVVDADKNAEFLDVNIAG